MDAAQDGHGVRWDFFGDFGLAGQGIAQDHTEIGNRKQNLVTTFGSQKLMSPFHAPCDYGLKRCGGDYCFGRSADQRAYQDQVLVSLHNRVGQDLTHIRGHTFVPETFSHVGCEIVGIENSLLAHGQKAAAEDEDDSQGAG